jgi:hypothetical protein
MASMVTSTPNLSFDGVNLECAAVGQPTLVGDAGEERDGRRERA